MAKALYEIRFNRNIYPANSPEAALRAFSEENELALEGLAEACEVIKEEHTQKLFMLVKMMEDSEQFEFNEIQTALLALLRNMGYYNLAEDIADCIITWVERFEDYYDAEELHDWIIS